MSTYTSVGSWVVSSELKEDASSPAVVPAREHKVYIWCTCEFVGLHHWEKAEGKVAYLRAPHRHKFYVKCLKRVTDLDREIEFITMKEMIEDYLNEKYHRKRFTSSCEMIAVDLLEHFNLDQCSVSEDSENGATVVR